MGCTVKQVAAMAGVSVRTLHYYDETGLLKPARCGANGYRLYEEPQLLTLQQILFYRELGFELKQIKEVLGREDFERVAALESHRKVLEQKLARTRELIGTIDRTIEHLRGARKMKVEEMFAGFSVAPGQDRFGERLELGELREPVDCKVSGRDTGGAFSVFELSVSGGPRHSHPEQDEWIYVLDGDWAIEVGGERLDLSPGGSVFIPRDTSHTWAVALGQPGRVLNVYQPAGAMESFFHAVSTCEELPTIEDAVNNRYREEQIVALHQLFEAHGLSLLGPGLIPD
jgi:DNA-binding transcriptional MerR regulator